MDHNSWSSNNYPIRWFITIVWYGFFCCLWCPVDGLSKEGLIFLRLPVWHNVTSPSDPCFSSHSVLSPQCHFTLKELTIQGHHFAEETSAWAREAASLTNQPTGIAREQVRVRRFISFYFLQFFFFSFRSTRFSVALWQTPLTLASSLSCSLSLLVIYGFSAPTLLCASKGASGKCHFKLHTARKSQAPSEQ